MKSQVSSPEQNLKRAVTGPHWREPTSLPQLAKVNDSTSVQDIYQSILWRIEAKCQSNDTMAIGLMGCLGKSGASTIVANLAVQASKQQRGRVLLIDANWQLPGMLKKFDATQMPGLYDILSGDLSPRECEAQEIGENLDLLCRGKWDEEQPTRVRPEMVEEMLADLRSDYGLILVDLPAAEQQRSALSLARQLDGTLLVARFEALKQTQAQRVLQRLQEDGVPVWGSIMNRHREYVPKWLQGWL